jgi:ABC-type polysaccharide/polyol phosphate export permease
MVFMIILTVGVALGITAIFGRPSLWDVLQQGKPWPVQVAWGLGVGLFASMVTHTVVDLVALTGLRRAR